VTAIKSKMKIKIKKTRKVDHHSNLNLALYPDLNLPATRS
jgi:hypothetical protein